MTRVLDLFCKAGGVSMGFVQAGFCVTGIDIEPQPSYPFKFVLGDALKADLSRFDLVWASPPCQGFTAYKRRPGHVRPRANLIPATRRLLQASGKPYVIENVPKSGSGEYPSTFNKKRWVYIGWSWRSCLKQFPPLTLDS